MEKMSKITVKKAAELMQVSPQFVRVGIQRGQLPIGYAVKNKSKWSYYISPEKFREVTGIEVEANDKNNNAMVYNTVCSRNTAV